MLFEKRCASFLRFLRYKGRLWAEVFEEEQPVVDYLLQTNQIKKVVTVENGPDGLPMEIEELVLVR